MQNGWIQDGRIQDGCHHQVEWEWLSEIFLSKMAELKMTESKMAAIIKLNQNEWVKIFFVQNGWIHDSRIQYGCHYYFEWECMSDIFLNKWLNPIWQNSIWLPSSSSVRMNDFESDWISWSQNFEQNDWIKDGRSQDGCRHLVNQIELVWVRVRVEGECFWVNLREDNKVSESNMAEFRMAAIIKLSQNEWVKVFLWK